MHPPFFGRVHFLSVNHIGNLPGSVPSFASFDLNAGDILCVVEACRRFAGR